MGVAVDQPGHDESPAEVDDLDAGRDRQGRPDGPNRIPFDTDQDIIKDVSGFHVQKPAGPKAL